MPPLRYLALLALALAPLAPVRAAEKTPAEDARLAASVSLNRARIDLGELVGELSRSSSVTLKATDEPIPLAGIPVLAVVHDRPVREVMESIRKLVSTNRCPCRWKEVGTGYKLIAEPAPSPRGARDEMLADFKKDFREFCEIVRTPEPRRATLLAARPNWFYGGKTDGDYAELLCALKPEQIDALISGEKVQVKADELPVPAARA